MPNLKNQVVLETGANRGQGVSAPCVIYTHLCCF
jgi:hypothetical protein